MAAIEASSIEFLSKIFQNGLDLFNKIDKTVQPTNSFEIQVDIKHAMSLLESATRLTSVAALFSTNEGIEEVATNDLQYLLLPALLGTLTLKLTSGDRKEIVECAEIYFKDFLRRCNDYGMTDYSVQEPVQESSNVDTESSTSCCENRSQFESLAAMATTRHNKIQRYKEQKDLQKKLEQLKANLDNPVVEDEVKRQYILTMINIFIHKSIDDLESINMEKPMLDHMEKIKHEVASKPVRGPPKSKPLLPVIITKNEAQKSVFGLGYPSLPTMTVKEFYDQRVKDGIFPDPSKPKAGPLSLQEQALAGIEPEPEQETSNREERIEKDDPEELERMRNMDEFKDDHRRGWGNRMNRS